jgi:hypothetical protein
MLSVSARKRTSSSREYKELEEKLARRQTESISTNFINSCVTLHHGLAIVRYVRNIVDGLSIGHTNAPKHLVEVLSSLQMGLTLSLGKKSVP